MKFPDRMKISAIALILTAMLLISPVMALDGTTGLHIVKYADDNVTILNEMTVDYHWLKDNLPVQGDDATHYYLQGPVSEASWNDIHPYKQYDALDPEEDIQSTFLDLGAIRGTDLADICNAVGGAKDGDTVALLSLDGTAITFPYEVIYEPKAIQGPAVLCWHCEDKGYTGADYTSGMRLAFFANASTNPSGWHIFGNADMANCWDEAYRTYNGTLPSSAAASRCRIREVKIFSQEPPEPPVPSFTANVTTGTAPLTVAFTDTSSGAPSVWTWDFGDGAASDEQNPVHTYAVTDAYPVNYTVTLTATNKVGTNNTAQKEYITLAGPYHVPVTLYAGNGGDYATIQAAVNAAGMGDTIIVKDGSYTENVNVNKTVAICSENGPGNVMVTAAVIEKPVFAIMADGVTIKGFTVRGPTKTPHVAGIESVGYDNCLITGNDCGGRCYNGIHLGGDATNNIVTENYCHNNTQRGLSLRDTAHGNYVYNNTCEDNTYQIYIKDGPYDNYVWENTFIGSVKCITDNTFHSPEPVTYTYNGTTHTDYVGNYYSNYTGSDANRDGIGETPVFLGHLLNTETNYYDEYPMMGSWENGVILTPAPATEFIRGPYFTGTTINLTIANWKTDQPFAGTVEFANDTFYTTGNTYDRSITDPMETTFHHLTLEDLTPDTLYHYRINAGGTTTTDHTFRTFPEHGNFTFIVYGDTQLPANVGIVADRIADENPLFILHTGDLVNAVESDSEWNNFFGSSRRMLANTTLYTVLGNHEKNESVYYETTGMPEWYSFDCSDAHFVSLDDNDCANIDTESAWLSQDLSTDTNWKFVAHHHPPYSSVSSRAGGWILLRDYWGQTMKDAGVNAVFNGHVHAYERCLVDGINYIVTGTGSGPLGPLGDEKTDGYQNSLERILGYTKITIYTNGTAAGEFVKVALLSDDNTQVLEVYPPGTVFETYTMTAPDQGADLAAVSLDVPENTNTGIACTITGTVENTGFVASSACPVTLSVDGVTVETTDIGPLAPKETAIVSFTWTPAATGETTLTLGVDPDEAALDLNRTNNYCTATVTVSGPSGQDDDAVLTLLPGWNFVSTPKMLANGYNTFAIFEGVDTAGHSVLLYTTAGQWVAMGADDEFRPLDGIWIYANNTCELALHYAAGSAQTRPAKNLVKGWNAIGFTNTVPGSAASTLLSVKGSWATLIGYNSSTQKYAVSIIRGANGRHGEGREMIPMQGYWLYLNEADTLCAIGV